MKKKKIDYTPKLYKCKHCKAKFKYGYNAMRHKHKHPIIEGTWKKMFTITKRKR